MSGAGNRGGMPNAWLARWPQLEEVAEHQVEHEGVRLPGWWLARAPWGDLMCGYFDLDGAYNASIGSDEIGATITYVEAEQGEQANLWAFCPIDGWGRVVELAAGRAAPEPMTAPSVAQVRERVW